jgi:hypothetical protein
MHIICSWCREEGQIGLVGQKDPIEDRRETHGICPYHFETTRNEWRSINLTEQPVDPARDSTAPDTKGVVIDARERFGLSPAVWWSGLKNIIRRAAGF